MFPRVLPALLLSALLGPGLAAAEDAVSARAIVQRVDSNGGHRVRLVVRDATGRFVPGLESRLSVLVAGRPVSDLRVRAAPQIERSRALTVIVDADLAAVESSWRSLVQRVIGVAADAVGNGGRARVVLAGAKARARDVSAEDAGEVARNLSALIEPGDPALREVLRDEMARATRRGAGQGAAVFVVTRGRDRGRDIGLSALLALARSPERPVSVTVLQLGETSSAFLEALATESGGMIEQARSSAEAEPLVPELLDSSFGDYRLEFRAERPIRDDEARTIAVTITTSSGSIEAGGTYRPRDLRAPAWWSSPPFGIAALAILLVAAGVAARAWPRRACLLVVEGGEEDGVWYEIRELPAKIGAAAGNDLVLFDPEISRNHAILEKVGRNIDIVDLNSEFGTYVEGRRVATRETLEDGARIRLGTRLELTFER